MEVTASTEEIISNTDDISYSMDFVSSISVLTTSGTW
jgi:hypothetical protein